MISGEVQTFHVTRLEDTNRFLREHQYQMEEFKESVTLRRNHEDYEIAVTFELPRDEFDLELEKQLQQQQEQEGQEEQEEDQEEEEEEEEEEEGEEEQEEEEQDGQAESKLSKTNTIVFSLEKKGKGEIPFLLCEFALGRDNHFYMENFRFDQEGRHVWVNDLSQELQSRLMDFFELLGLNETLGVFINDYSDNYKASYAKTSLEHLVRFLREPASPIKKTPGKS